MLDSSEHASRQVGFWLAVTTVLFVIGWRLWVVASQRHLLAVATEVGSIAQFRRGLFPASNGTNLVFSRETETGIGTFFCETASGNSKLLFEQKEKGYLWQSGMLGWSPDDRFFACNVLSDSDSLHPKNDIIVYNGNSGEPMTKIAADGYQWGSKFIWLSPYSFAFTTYNQAWLVYEQKADGTWIQTQAIKRFAEGDLTNLTVTSPHSVAWQQSGDVWTYDFTTGASEKIWVSTNNNLESFVFLEENGNFLLRCRDKNGPLSICFRPRRLWDKQGAVLDVTRNDDRTRYADLRLDQGRYSFTIQTGTNAEPTHFVWDGMLEYYKLAGDYLYFAGNRANEVPGIWQYNIHNNAVRRLLSNQKNDFQRTQFSPPVVGMGTNAFGRQISYHLWEPLHVSQGKKYPLIIGQAHYVWSPYQQVALSGGYYFAAVDRATWADDIDNWPEDVLGLYEMLAKNPNVDTNRIYLAAFSAESGDVIQVLDEMPDMCQGVILFNPEVQPNLSQVHLSRIFIVGGGDDNVGSNAGQLMKYQDEAAKAGVPVTLVIQKGAQHLSMSVATERERTRQFARFLIEN